MTGKLGQHSTPTPEISGDEMAYRAAIDATQGNVTYNEALDIIQAQRLSHELATKREEKVPYNDGTGVEDANARQMLVLEQDTLAKRDEVTNKKPSGWFS